MKILVTGGNGFVGRAVCAMAVERGLDVASLSRTGAPLVTSGALQQVEWLRGNVFDGAVLEQALSGVDAVVHSIGISREHPSRRESFRMVNGDAAIAVGDAARKAGVGTFVFLSAGEKPPWAHEEYLSSKRRAELALAKLCERLVVLRPGLVYGPERKLATFVAQVLRVSGFVHKATRESAAITPIHITTLARAVLRALSDPGARGVVEAPRLATFAEVALATVADAGL